MGALPRAVGEVLEVRTERLFDARAGRNLLSLRLAGGGGWLHARLRAPLRQASMPARSGSAAPAPPEVAAVPEYTSLELAERTRIVQAMNAAKWRPLQAAAMLGLSRATLYRRIKHLKIVPPHRQ